MNSILRLLLSLTLTNPLGSAFTTIPLQEGLRRGSRLQAHHYQHALLFDCDGVILETEELHRLAYNAAFDAFGLTIDGQPVNWSVRWFR